jgi:AbrB family looped-hinge helix DNA binding protein
MSGPVLRHSAPSGIWPQVTLRRDAATASQSIDVKVAGNGRMVLPASVRKGLGLHGDAKVILTVEKDQVRLSPIGHGVSRAQALYREHAKQARTVDDFLFDRKVEAVAEAGEPFHSGPQENPA